MVYYQFRLRHCRSLCAAALFAGMFLPGPACAADDVLGKPATVADVLRVLDFAEFPLIDGADSGAQFRLAGVNYTADATVKQAIGRVREKFNERQWSEMSGGYLSAEGGTTSFRREGYLVSVSISALAKSGKVKISMVNRGNLDLKRLPVPKDAKPLYSGPFSEGYASDLDLEKTAKAVRSLLQSKGWQFFGESGHSLLFRQNAVLLTAEVAPDPDQDGKSVIRLSAELMSVDLPALPDSRETRYLDELKSLEFESSAAADEILGFYRAALEKTDYRPTTDKPVEQEQNQVLVFANPRKEQVTLQLAPDGERVKVQLVHRTAAERAALSRQAAEPTVEEKAAADEDRPVVLLVLPDEAGSIKVSKAQIEFTIAKGRGRTTVESLRRRLARDGWKQSENDVKGLFGTCLMARGKQQLKLEFVEPGGAPAEITISAKGCDLEQKK